MQDAEKRMLPARLKLRQPRPYPPLRHALIRRYAKRQRLTVGEATLLRAQLALEIKQHRLRIPRQKQRPRRAA